VTRRRGAIAVVGALVLALGCAVIWRGSRDGAKSRRAPSAAAGTVHSALAATQPKGRRLSWLAQLGAPARRIAGRVVFEGQPVGGASVHVVSAADREQHAATRTTSADGRFDFGPYAPTPIVIAAYAPDKAAAVLELDLRNPALRPASDALVLELYPCDAELHGVILDAGGGTVPSASIRRGPVEVIGASDGTYSLCVPIGTANLEVGAEGYGTVTVSLAVTNHMRRDFRLSPEGVISGRAVRAGDGAPVPDAVVSVPSTLTSRGGEMATSGGAGARAVTDADGRFRIEGLTAGRRELDASADGLRARTMDVNVMPQGGGEDIIVTLESAATVRGRVVDESGVAVVGTDVLFSDRDRVDSRDAERLRAVSQADGVFVIDGVLPGTYSVDSTPYIPAKRLRIDVPVAGVSDVQLVVRRGSMISGAVFRDGKPVAGALVYTQTGGFSRARSESDGRFALVAIHPGEHELYADSSQLGAFNRGPTVSVTAGKDVSGVTIDLALAGSVEGVVVDQHGEPVAGAFLSFSLGGRDFGESTTTDNGMFKARAMSGGGEYQVTIMASRQSSIRFLPANGDDFPPVHLADGDSHVTGVRYEVIVDRLDISGTVVDEQGKPRPDVRVEAIPRGNWSDSAEALVDVTSADGTFTISDLLAGDYNVVARGGDGAEMRTPSSVAAGSRNVRLVLATPGAIEGTLVGFSSTPNVFARLTSGGPGSMMDAGLKATTVGTTFRIRGVAPGTYSVLAISRGVLGDAQTIEVSSAATAKVTLSYRGTGTITATVVDIAGKPVPGALCMYNDEAWNSDHASTDAQGKLTISAAPVGRVYVHCHVRGDHNVSGFAPANVVANKTTAVSIRMAPYEEPKPSGTIGATFGTSAGVLRVAAVIEGGPSATAGVKAHDIVAGFVIKGDQEYDVPFNSLDGRLIDMLVSDLPPGTPVALKLRRGTETLELQVTVAAP
jgi:hypothetical protein